jgi:HK97 family phage prohead protease
MAETIFKTFRPEIKAVNEATGEIDMLIPMSTASTDRDGESIDPLGWRKSLPAFRKRPVLLSSHNYGDLRKQIGEFMQVKVTEDGLFAKPKYYVNEGNEEADWAFKLASKGMAAYSVGFIPKSWVDGDGEKSPARTYTEQELLEISHVVVPSNRDAIQGLRGKSKDPTINQVVEDIITDLADAPVVDLAGEKVPGVIVATTTNSVDDTVTVTADVVTGEVIVNSPRVHSQQEITDELDYIRTLAKENGLSDENRKLLSDIAQEIARIPDSDISAEDKAPDNERINRIINQTVSHFRR